MSKNIRTLYLYVVSFITLCMMVGAFVGIVNTTVSYFAPNVSYYGSIYPVDYAMDGNSTISAQEKENITSGATTGLTTFDEQKAIADYKAGFIKAELAEKTRNLKSIFSAIAVLLVASPLFVYHWSRIEKDRKEEGAV